jgi:hypothetical protein
LWTTGFGNVTVRVYVDGEPTAAVAFRLYEAHALGFGWKQGERKMWGTDKFGKGSLFGGLFLTFPIPFSTSLVVTAELPESDRDPLHPQSHGLYFIARGLLGGPQPVRLDGGSVELPPTARLRLHTTRLVAAPHVELTLANVSGGGGALYQVTLLAESGTAHFLEGEVHATLDGDRVALSSGTEDYFLSAQYFDGGEFQFPLSGCNHLSLACLDGIGTCQVAAYRFHDRDPVLFQRSMALHWQVGDPFWKVDPTRVVAYAWVYEW